MCKDHTTLTSKPEYPSCRPSRNVIVISHISGNAGARLGGVKRSRPYGVIYAACTNRRLLFDAIPL